MLSACQRRSSRPMPSAISRNPKLANPKPPFAPCPQSWSRGNEIPVLLIGIPEKAAPWCDAAQRSLYLQLV